MKRKGIISLILCLAMMVTCILPASAEVTVESVAYNTALMSVDFNDMASYPTGVPSSISNFISTASTVDKSVTTGVNGGSDVAFCGKLGATGSKLYFYSSKGSYAGGYSRSNFYEKNMKISYDLKITPPATAPAAKKMLTRPYMVFYAYPQTEGGSNVAIWNFWGVDFSMDTDGKVYANVQNGNSVEIDTSKWYSVSVSLNMTNTNVTGKVPYEFSFKSVDGTLSESKSGNISLSSTKNVAYYEKLQFERSEHPGSVVAIDNYKVEDMGVLDIKSSESVVDMGSAGVNNDLDVKAVIPAGYNEGSVKLKLGEEEFAPEMVADTVGNNCYNIKISAADLEGIEYGKHPLSIEAVYGETAVSNAYEKEILITKTSAAQNINVIDFEGDAYYVDMTSANANKETLSLNQNSSILNNKNGEAVSKTDPTIIDDLVTIKKATGTSNETNALYYYNDKGRDSNLSYIERHFAPSSGAVLNGIARLEFDVMAGATTSLNLEPRTLNSGSVTFASTGNSTRSLISAGKLPNGKVLETGSWHHFVLDFDIANKLVVLYVDGTIILSDPITYKDETKPGLRFMRMSVSSGKSNPFELYIDNLQAKTLSVFPKVTGISYKNNEGNEVSATDNNVSAIADAIVVSMEDAVENVTNNTVKLYKVTEQGTSEVVANVLADGKKIVVEPQVAYLDADCDYKIVVGKDVTYGGVAFGAVQTVSFATYLDTEIIYPKNGQEYDLSEDTTMNLYATAPNAESVEFLVNDASVKTVNVSSATGWIAEGSLDISTFPYGASEVKAVVRYADGTETKVLSSDVNVVARVKATPQKNENFDSFVVDDTKKTTTEVKLNMAQRERNALPPIFYVADDSADEGENDKAIAVYTTEQNITTTSSNSDTKTFYVQCGSTDVAMKGIVNFEIDLKLASDEDDISMEIDCLTEDGTRATFYPFNNTTGVEVGDTYPTTTTKIFTDGHIGATSSTSRHYTGETYNAEEWVRFKLVMDLEKDVLYMYRGEKLIYKNDNLLARGYSGTAVSGKAVKIDAVRYFRPSFYHDDKAKTDKKVFETYTYDKKEYTNVTFYKAFSYDNLKLYSTETVPTVGSVSYVSGDATAVSEDGYVPASASALKFMLNGTLGYEAGEVSAVKVYEDGKETSYSAAYSEEGGKGVITVTPANGFNAHKEIKVVIPEDAVTGILGLAVGKTISSSVKAYDAEKLYIGTDIRTVSATKAVGSIDAYNMGETAKTVNAYVASYVNEGRLAAIKVVEVTVLPGENKTVSQDVVSGETGKYAKIFVWDSLTNAPIVIGNTVNFQAE